MKRLLLLGIILLAWPATAGDWGLLRGSGASATCDTSRPNTSLQAGETGCYELSTNDDDSTVLSVGNCENVDFFYYADKNGDGTDCTLAFSIQDCPMNGLTDTEADNGCTDVNSGVSDLSSSNTVESNLAGVFLRLDADTGANHSDCRVLVKCAQRSN